MPPGNSAARRLGKEEMTYLIRGASVLGTGGGGSYSIARALVEDLAERGMTVELLHPAQLEPGALGVSTAILGGGLTHEEAQNMGMITVEPASLRAARELEKYLNRSIDFVFPIEIGPQNTMEAVRLAACLGVPVLDGDCAGRAVPEMQQTTLSLLEIPLTPVVAATFQGDLIVLSKVVNDGRSEALLRALATSSGNLICITGFPVSGQRLMEAIIPGTLSNCMEIGSFIGSGHQPGDRIASNVHGRVAFRGRVHALDVECRGGFFRGMLEMEGTGSFIGEIYQIGIQNEFMWSWRNGVQDIECPDLACVIESDSGLGKVTYGHGFENAIEIGEDLTVLHVPCAPIWRGARGHSAFPAPPHIPEGRPQSSAAEGSQS